MGFNSSPKFKVKSHNIIVAIFTNKTVLASIALTLLFIIIFHIGSTVSVPGIVITGGALNTNTFASMLNLLAGGGLSRLSVFSVGVGPYITSQIIVQLLSSDLIPPLSRMAKSGERGKKKLEIITRILTLPFCVAQSYAVVALILQNSNGSITIFGATTLGDLSVGSIVALISIFTAGSYISLFIGDMITKRGVGNGITLLILSGIVASVFSNFSIAYDTIAGKFDQTKLTETITMIISVILYFALFVVLMLAVVFIDQSIRKIPIQQTGQGLITEVEKLPFLPLKINVAGVIPVIFASSLMTIPETIGQFLSSSNEFG
jgi:preprotein translocase subunit SecY